MKQKLVSVLTLSLFLFSTAAFSAALLIEDVLPWNYNSNSQTLADIGIGFTKINSSALAGLTVADLASYDFIVFSSAQYQTYYDNIATSFSKIDQYVSDGGVLVAHSCLWGWPGNGEWNAPFFLPGGVDRVQQYTQSVSITDPTSPIIAGPYGTITESQLQGWNYSAHGYFTNLVEGTKTIIDLDDPDKPIYIEYAWGSGHVRATMMTVEWGANDPTNSRYIFRQNEFYQAQKESQPVPEPGTLALLGMGLLFFGFIRKRN